MNIKYDEKRNTHRKHQLSDSWSSNPESTAALETFVDNAYQNLQHEQRHGDVINRLDSIEFQMSQIALQIKRLTRSFQALSKELQEINKKVGKEKKMNTENEVDGENSDYLDESDVNSDGSRCY